MDFSVSSFCNLAEPNYIIEFDLSIRQRCKLETSKLTKRLWSIDFYLISAVSVNMRCVGMWEKTDASKHICCLHFCRCSICTENIYENYIIQYWPLYWITIYFNLNNACAKGYHILNFFQKKLRLIWNTTAKSCFHFWGEKTWKTQKEMIFNHLHNLYVSKDKNQKANPYGFS